MNPSELVQPRPQGRPQNPGPSLLVQGKLHLDRQSHARAGRRLTDTLGQQAGQPGHLNLLPVDHPSLAQGGHLFTHRHPVPWPVDRHHIAAKEVQIVLPHLHKVRPNAMTEVPFPRHLNFQRLTGIVIVFHVTFLLGLIASQDTPPPHRDVTGVSSKRNPESYVFLSFLKTFLLFSGFSFYKLDGLGYNELPSDIL